VTFDLRDKNVFLDLALSEDTVDGVTGCVLKNGGQIAVARHEADYIVTPDVSKPGLRNMWVAVLKGVGICSAEFIISNGASGSMLVYKNIQHSRRYVWVSRAFKTNNAGIWAAIEPLLGQKALGSKWTMLTLVSSGIFEN
jgi:hypothetical protein